MNKWQTIRADKFCFDVTDGTHDSPKPQTAGRKLITSKHLKGYYIDFDSANWISEADYQKVITRSRVEQWDILYSMIGTIGNMYLEKNPVVDYACKNMGIFKFNGNKNDAYWMYYYLKSPQAISYINSHLRGSTQSYVPLGGLREMPVPVPPIEIRQSIIGILRSIDDKIENNQKIKVNLLKQLTVVYKSWYRDFSLINDSDFVDTEYGKVPHGWKYTLLGDLCQSVSVKHKFNKEELIFLNTGDIEDGRFLHSNYMTVKDMPGQAKKTIAPGDILYSEIRPANRHFAYVNIPSDDYVVSTKLMVIRAKNIDSRRLYHYLTSDDILIELQHQAESRSGTFPQIRFENVSRLPVLIADERTESKFTDILHCVYDQIDHLNIQNEKLAELRDSILPKLMTREIDVSAIRF